MGNHPSRQTSMRPVQLLRAKLTDACIYVGVSGPTPRTMAGLIPAQVLLVGADVRLRARVVGPGYRGRLTLECRGAFVGQRHQHGVEKHRGPASKLVIGGQLAAVRQCGTADTGVRS